MLQNRVETFAPGTSTGFNEVQFNKDAIAETVMRPEPDFEQIKHLCSDKPLRFARRATIDEIEALEDQIDVKDALQSLKDEGSIGLDDFKKQLGI